MSIMEGHHFIGYLLSFLSLTILELVLGVDNLIFISICSNRLPIEQQPSARRFGLLFAMVTRLILLATAFWLTELTNPLVTVNGFNVTGRDLFFLLGGFFLLYKATEEIHAEFNEAGEESSGRRRYEKFWVVVTHIGILDIVFSLDSVITAVGLTNNFWIMAAAIIISILGMMFASTPLSSFINRHPSVRMLAFSFLIMVGMVLVADGLHFHVPRGYVYFAVAFSIFVEFMNIARRKKFNNRRG